MSDLADAIRPRKLSLRQEIFDDLLTRYTDARQTCFGRSGPGMGDGYVRMPSVWTPTYRALERVLLLYREYANKKVQVGLGQTMRSDYWHLAQWYLLCRRYPQWPKKRLMQRGREIVEVQPPVRWIVDRHADTDHGIVHVSLLWLDDEWDRSVIGRRFDLDDGGRLVEMGEPQRPPEFRAEVGERVAA